MKPLSSFVRRLYLGISIASFLLVLPVVIFYADGWRYQSSMGFVKTGGIYISVPYTEADVYIDEEHIGRSGFLNRSFYVDNLLPSAYTVRVQREGDRWWERQLVVEQQIVTDTRALLIPDELPIHALATSTESAEESLVTIITQEELETIVAVFATTTIASSTIPIDEFDGIGLYLINGDIYARWLRTDGLASSVFCGRPSYCVDEIPIKRGGSAASYAKFFGGGIVYRTVDGTVQFVEVDVRPSPLSIELYKERGADARVIGDRVVIKRGREYFEVAGL